MNEPTLLQISTSGSRGKDTKRSTLGVSRSEVKLMRPNLVFEAWSKRYSRLRWVD